jgi:hypothetical protein
MNGVSQKFCAIPLLALLLSGCKNVQTPTLAPSRVDEQSVNRDFSYHDPLPDNDAGPFVERQRGFERPRALPRRAEERYQITNQLQMRDGEATGTNPSASRYPNSVEP